MPTVFDDQSLGGHGPVSTYSRRGSLRPGDRVRLDESRKRRTHEEAPADPQPDIGVVVQTFDDPRAPLAYVSFEEGGDQWVFTHTLLHVG